MEKPAYFELYTAIEVVYASSTCEDYSETLGKHGFENNNKGKMIHPADMLRTSKALISYFRSGTDIRSRSVSDFVLHHELNIPLPPARLIADWAREVSRIELNVGDVEALPLARTILRWPAYPSCVQAMSDWMDSLELPDLFESSEIALMGCTGARYHHDGNQYGGAAFCNLFLSEDKGLDLHFPAIDYRIPLIRGTAVIFDTVQPHAVIRRGSVGFNADDFPADQDWNQIFLTWVLPIENEQIQNALGIAFHVDPTNDLQINEGQVRLNGDQVDVCPKTGRWCPT